MHRKSPTSLLEVGLLSTVCDEYYDIHISYSSLYRILSEAGIKSPKKDVASNH